MNYRKTKTYSSYTLQPHLTIRNNCLIYKIGSKLSEYNFCQLLETKLYKKKKKNDKQIILVRKRIYQQTTMGLNNYTKRVGFKFFLWLCYTSIRLNPIRNIKQKRVIQNTHIKLVELRKPRLSMIIEY